MNLNSPNLSPLDDIELWKKHTDNDANAAKALRVCGQWKQEYPDGIGIGELCLYHCGLTSLPPTFGRSVSVLTSLTRLYCSFNQLTTLPPEIGTLTSLTHFDCDNNQLTTLPPEIGRLTSLRLLQCSHNQLMVLPSEIGALTSLTHLYCYNNELTVLPIEIGALASLTDFYCSNDQFAEGEPTTIEELQERWRTHQMRRIKATRT